MIRKVVLASSFLALAGTGCVDTTGGDDAAVALAIGTVQGALEAQSALLVGLDSCTTCTNLQELGLYLEKELGSCASMSSLSKASADDVNCTDLLGKPVGKVALNSCDLGLGKPISGTLLVTQASGSVLRYYETDLISGDSGVAACGQVSGAGGAHSINYASVAHGPSGGDVEFYWVGPATIDGANHVRSGTFAARFVGADGIGYEVEGEGSSLTRASGSNLPHAGLMSFQGKEGTAKIEFGADTPLTGGIRLTRSNGVQETVIIPR